MSKLDEFNREESPLSVWDLDGDNEELASNFDKIDGHGTIIFSDFVVERGLIKVKRIREPCGECGATDWQHATWCPVMDLEVTVDPARPESCSECGGDMRGHAWWCWVTEGKEAMEDLVRRQLEEQVVRQIHG